MSDQEKLNMMRFWLFGTFLIIFVATVIFVGGVLGTGFAILGQTNFWISFIIGAVLCVLWYYVYKWYLGRNK